MPLQPSIQIPERILAFGPPGSGKTTNWLDIAKWAEQTGSDSQFYVLDTDFSVDRMLISYPEISKRVHISVGYDWDDYSTFLHLVSNKATPADWVVVDFIGSAWATVQSYFTEQVFKQDIADYFLQARKELGANKSLSTLDGWTDWSVINALYKKWVNPLLFKGRYHLYATAKGDSLSSDKKPTEDASTRQLFLPLGVKPVGQKDLAFQFHTVLLTNRSREARTITSVKDRERGELAGVPVKSFVMDYLVKVGGWKF
jgi:AAA domain